MTGLVSTAGVHGYSSPCPDHVVFSVSPDIYSIISQSEAWASLCAEHLEIGEGCWEGVRETSFCLPLEVYEEMNRRWPFIMRDQDIVLVLGTPESQNWRPAALYEPDLNNRSDFGTWHEVTEEQARASSGWSFFNGHWFICEDDPADSVGTEEERLLEAKAALLDKVFHPDLIVRNVDNLGFDVWVPAELYAEYKRLTT